MELHILIIWFGTGIIAISFFVALWFAKKEKPSYFNYVFAFIVLGLLTSANTFWALYFNSGNPKIAYLIERGITLFQFFTLGLFYIDILRKSKFVRKIKQLFYLAIIIQIALLIITIIRNYPIYNKISSNLFLIIFSVFYYRDILNNEPKIILIKSPIFWIVTGIFFSYCVSFPIHSLHPFINRNPEYINIRSQIFAISNMAFIIMYFLIIKSYLSIQHPQNLSSSL